MANPFDDFDSSSAAGTATAPTPSPAPTSPQANPFDSFDAPKNPFDSFDAPSAPRMAAQDLAQQDHSAIFQHAAQNPEDFETAYQADKLRRARPWTAKAAEMVRATPGAVWDAAKGVWTFATGIPQVALHSAEQFKAAHPMISDALPFGFAIPDQAPETLQAENTLAAQHGEQAITNATNSIINLRPSNYEGGWGENTGEIDTRTADEVAADEDKRQRAIFAQRVQQAKNEIQLLQGRPLDTGAIAGIYHLAGQQPSEEVGPEALQAAGVPQADPATVGRLAAASDPTMIALSAAPGLPGAAKVGGAATELAGKALGGVGNAVSATTRALSPITALRRIVNPASLVTDAAKEGGARGLSALGDAMAQQGKELRTGTPSALTTASATAEATGEGAIGTNIKRAVGNFAAKGASTAAGMAPLNAVLSDGDPKAFVESEAGAGAFGGTFGALARNRPMMVEAIRPHLQSEGARALAEAGEGNDPLAIKSAAYVMSLPEEARNRTLESIGALQGLPTDTPNGPQRAKLYVLNDSDYKNVIAQKFGMQQAAMGGGRGFYIGDDGAAYVNGDYHSGLDPSELGHTVGHEFGGHAAINIMQAMGSKGGELYNGLMSSARNELIPNGQPTPDFQRFIRQYNFAFDPTGQTQRLDFKNPESIEEFISETAGQIMANRGAGEIALPQSIQDKFNRGLGQFMGKLVGVDTRKVGTPTNFGRQEVGALTQMVQDTLGQVAGMKLRGGAEIPEPAKTTQTRLNELNAILAKLRPAVGRSLEEMRAWISEHQAAQRELTQLQHGQAASFPAAGAPPVAPSTPQAPNVPAPAPASSRASVAAALRLNGISREEAAHWAQQAQGSTVGEMVIDALKQRAAAKFPSQPPAAQTPPNQPTVLPPAATTTPEVLPDKANEPAPAQTPNEDGTLPPSRVETEERVGENLETPQPLQVQTPEHLDKIAAQAREQFLSDKEPAKSGKNKGQHTAANVKAADKAAFDAAAEAHAETVPENYQGLRQRTDAFGQKSISGKVDPSRPFDSWLIKQAMDSGHLTPESLKTLLTLQDSIGKTVSYDYGHAPVSEEGDMRTKEGRSAEQAKSSVADRLAGGPMQTERKTSVPLRIGYNSGTKSFSVYGVSQEKLLNNYNHLAEKMQDLGITRPFRDINDPKFVAAFKAIIRNQEHGWTGDGKSPSVGTEEFPNRPDPDWKNSPEHTIVPDDQFQFVNAILADEGAKPPKRGDATVSKAKAHLANENNRLLSAEGETNPLRRQINEAEPGWTKATLEDPLNENISPALASNIGPASQSDESIRVHGKAGDISRFFDKGQTPNRAKTSAGFLPDTGPSSAKPKFMPEDDAGYRGLHSAPMKDSGAPIDNLTDIYPDDIYSSKGAQYYGHWGDARDNRSISIIQSLRGKPNESVKIYRAIPDDLTNGAKIEKLEDQKRIIQRRGKLPLNVETSLSPNEYYNAIADQLEKLKALPPEEEKTAPTIKPGDWITIDRNYAKDHGDATLNGQYKILSKTVKARDIFTNGDSIHEWGYDPQPRTPKESAQERIAARTSSANASFMPDTGKSRSQPFQMVMHRGDPWMTDTSSSPVGTHWTHDPDYAEQYVRPEIGTQYDVPVQTKTVSLNHPLDLRWINPETTVGELKTHIKNSGIPLDLPLSNTTPGLQRYGIDTIGKLIDLLGKEPAALGRDFSVNESLTDYISGALKKHGAFDGVIFNEHGNPGDTTAIVFDSKSLGEKPPAQQAAQQRLGKFMPDSKSRPEDETTPAGQGPSGSPQARPAIGGTSKEDTGRPEDGETQGERLMREAEAAGLAPSLETTKAILRGDQQAFAKLRAMIKSRTGKDARFLPSTRVNAKEAAQKRILARAQ